MKGAGITSSAKAAGHFPAPISTREMPQECGDWGRCDMGKSVYPVCDRCGVSLSPDFCSSYFFSGGETLCPDCFVEAEQEIIAEDPIRHAMLTGAQVYYPGCT